MAFVTVASGYFVSAEERSAVPEGAQLSAAVQVQVPVHYWLLQYLSLGYRSKSSSAQLQLVPSELE